ncbi:MAG: hypothetical protein IPG87_19580 [Saprospiraceae bacterium]|nr:hypothetical protein [Candidatus Vicinibacter affinis]
MTGSSRAETWLRQEGDLDRLHTFPEMKRRVYCLFYVPSKGSLPTPSCDARTPRATHRPGLWASNNRIGMFGPGPAFSKASCTVPSYHLIPISNCCQKNKKSIFAFATELHHLAATLPHRHSKSQEEEG